MADDDRSAEASSPVTSGGASKEATESLACSICLELLYKPVVTACGHMFCFWCGYYGMNGFRASSCPLCRRSFMYFPRICGLLHFMLMKAFPDEYARRACEARCHEEEHKRFSPELAPHELSALRHFKQGVGATTTIVNSLVSTSNDHSMLSSPESNSNPQCGQQAEDSSRHENLTKDDLCCALCHSLLYRPVVLNCGDVFCEPCLKMHNFKVHCPTCKAPHPPGSVLVCLQLDQFVQIAFPAEYANRRLQHPAESSTPFADFCETVDTETEAYLHIGVGCDGCGMLPIIGDRYKCDDCEEAIGFDVCGSCYKSGSLTGRFNQKHQPTHRMRQVTPHQHMEQLLQALRNNGFHSDDRASGWTDMAALS